MLSEAEIHEKCENIATEAYRGCGQSDILWANNVRTMIDGWLHSITDENERQLIITIAEQHGYSTDEYSDPDMCRHGLDYDCCPCGCGES